MQAAREVYPSDRCDDTGTEEYWGQTEFICVVVLQAPLPFHMVRDIRLLSRLWLLRWSQPGDQSRTIPLYPDVDSGIRDGSRN